ncbi:hypothetical protein MMC12_004237 [Toensbergia leucococca]|nr:hypothetical protein [Toensbergia leucococca]
MVVKTTTPTIVSHRYAVGVISRDALATLKAPEHHTEKESPIMKLRIMKLSSAPPRSLYTQEPQNIISVSSVAPRKKKTMASVAGMEVVNRRRVCSSVILPAASGRQGLLRRSSWIDCGRRWFASTNTKVLSHVHKSTAGTRRRTATRSGVLLLKGFPDNALSTPKVVSGKTKVL